MKAPKHKKKRHAVKDMAGQNRVKALNDKIYAQVKGLAEPLCEAEGMELVHLEFQRESGGRTMRLYIDKPGGVRLDDCVAISRQLGDLLDVSLAIEEAYHLEVSSPGINRPLTKLTDFERFQGAQAKIRLTRAIDGRKNFSGVILGTAQETILLQVDDQRIVLAFSDIAKAQLINYNGER